MIWLAALTHLVAATIGGFVVYCFVFRLAGERLPAPHFHHHHHHHGEHGERMETETNGRPDQGLQPESPDASESRIDASSRLVLVLIAASLVVAGIGVQAYLGDRKDAQQRQCFGTVVNQLTSSIGVGRSANRMLEESESARNMAEGVRDDAVDRIISVVAKGRAPGANLKEYEREFIIALARHQEAKRALRMADSAARTLEDEVESLRDAAPLPTTSACGVDKNGDLIE